jgi:alkylhydroperoxidase family enzyme
MAGLGDEEIADSRRGTSTDRKTEAILQFARKIVTERGWVSDDDVQSVRAAGVSDAEIAETVATVALNIFTNYFNHVAGTEVDFPEVAPAEAAA